MSSTPGSTASVPPLKHRISAGVIVEQDAHVLLVHCVQAARYDFWVAPGGGVQGCESLAEAAAREAFEETGLTVRPGRLVYIEELFDPGTRYCKFWHLGEAIGGDMDVSHAEAVAEGIVEVAWLSRADIAKRTVFPLLLNERFWADRDAGFTGVVSLPLRSMTHA